MKQLLAICLVLVLAVTAVAGDNPQVYAYISFDPAGDPEQNAVTPAPYSAVHAYVCLGCIEGGMTVISFGLTNAVAECPGVMATQAFVNLLPGSLAPIGYPFLSGVTVGSSQCMTTNPVIVGYGTYFYLGGHCCIEIRDHANHPRRVSDCQDPDQVDLYCLAGHGAVGGATCPEAEDCPCDGTPVEDATWGGVKALYR